jgi:hypothetical protein
MKPRIDPPFWNAVLMRTDLYNFLMAWSGIGAALGLVALTVEDALRRKKR